MRRNFLLHHGIPTRKFFLMILILGALLLLRLPCLWAAGPITPSGLNTQVSDPITVGAQTQYNITGGTRPGGGINLFHSFGDFGVPANNIANFLNETALPTSNILGRVTGGSISTIFGTIQTTGFETANLFLMNPNGFLFGPNATVNVGGMATFTTADYMRLTDGGRFNANPNAIPADLLTAAPVAAFGFIGSNPQAINFEGGQLTDAHGTGLALVGGDINLVPDLSGTPSGITAPGRPIQLTSGAGPGEVAAETGMPAPGMTLGTITLGQGTVISTAGDPTFGDGSGGAVSIRGGQFVATDAQILTSPAFGSTGQGGAVTIASTDSTSFTNSTIDTSSLFANGGGGSVSVTASDLTLQDSTITTSVFGDGITPITGGGGAVTLTGTASVNLTRSIIATGTIFSNGNGGAVTLMAPIVSLEEGSFINTGVVGDGITPSTASGGAVTLAGTTSVSSQRSSISTESFDTEGNSGAVKITAPTVTIVGSPDTQGIITSTHSFSGDPSAGNGGEIEITGTNVTLTDYAHLESVADSPGTFSRGGTIRITGSENILLDNETFFLTTTTSQGSAGNMDLVSQHVTIRGQSALVSETFGPASGGTIRITGGENVAIESASRISTTSPFAVDNQGPAGHIEFNTQQLTITGGSQVSSSTFHNGAGGSITVQGTSSPAQSVLISGAGSGLSTETHGSGAGGNISIESHRVQVADGAIISAKTTVSGNAGNILVKADSVSIESGAQLTSSSSIRQTPFFPEEVIPSPTGNAGNVTVQGLASPAQSVLIDGSGILTNTEGTGTGGTIMVNANQVQLNNGGLITASTTGAGAGGSINIVTGTFASNASTVSSTAAQTKGGDITITAGQSVTLNNGSSVSASSTGAGNAGNILINAGQNYTSTNSAVTTQAAQASGGNITVLATDMVHLTNSQINASVQGATETVGGNITIDPQYVILQNSQILARATQGQGGAISITITNGGFFLADATSTVSASSQFGVNGPVTIQSPNAPASGKIIPLSQKPLLATSLLNQRCAALAGGEFSSFTVAGRDSLPAEPGSWLASPLALLSADTGLEGMTLGASLAGDTPFLSLRQIAPAGFLTQAFAVDWSAGCQS